MKEVKTIRKKFCSDLCRVNFNNEAKANKQIREILNNPAFNKIKREVFFDLLINGESVLEQTKEELVNKPITAHKKENKADAPQKQREVKSEQPDAPRREDFESDWEYKLAFGAWKREKRLNA